MSETKNLLFVCTANQQRSPTAESLFEQDARYVARSCGTHALSRTECSEKLVEWADCIFCMEESHKQNLLRRFPDAASDKIRVLGIPDVFARGDRELVTLLREKLSGWLE
jgi:predicted protein tyrosine phosphatase